MNTTIDIIDIDEDGLVRVDGVTIGRRVIVKGHVILQVKDRHRSRVIDRGREYVQVDLVELLKHMRNGSHE